MFSVTFYSYKGGVGRTMALVNVAALLAQADKRVLIVDFDLEAPGVPSYGPLTAASGKPGIVDYVHEYIRTNEVPDVTDFIVPCSLGEGQQVWVMPAGDNTAPDYTQRFGSIDWGNLYEHRHGYLLIEDMKQQWAAYEGMGFDYVLIDSRTGNTDVGGICTRQLPDTVAIMFIPTRQNIDGLVPIVDLIRQEPGTEERGIDLVFSPSNIPDVYDENDVLGQALKDASKQLNYGQPDRLEPPVVNIHHWENMDLLELPLIVQSREKSRLANEYHDLKMAIIGQNAADREGALYALKRMPKIYESARRERNTQAATRIIERANEITRRQPGDGELAYSAAEVFSKSGDYEEEERNLTEAINAGVKVVRSRMLRAVARINLNKKSEAVEDLRAVLLSPDGSLFEFRPAARMLRAVSSDPEKEVHNMYVNEQLKPRAMIELAPLLMQNRRYLDLVANSLVKAIEQKDASKDLVKDLVNPATLALIGAGHFKKAIELIEQYQVPDDLPSSFNLAIARWGHEREVPLELFRFLNDHIPKIESVDANTHQCFALIRAALGHQEAALDELQRARECARSGLVFSCWTFTRRSAYQFEEDLEKMHHIISRGKVPRPPFLANPR